jgi:hypothetical protein
LTNADMAGADPWHGYFSGSLGSLSVLGTAPDTAGVTRNLILGGGAGTVITTPETLPLLSILPVIAGLLFAGSRYRRVNA